MALSRGEILENPKVIGDTTNSGEVRILDGADTNYVGLSVPDSVTTYTIDFPGAIGTNQQALRISAVPVGGVAVLEWYTPTAAAGGSDTQLQYNNAGSIAGVSGFTSDGTNLSATGTFTTESTIALSDGTNAATFESPSYGGSTTYTLPTNGSSNAGQALIVAAGSTVGATILEWGTPSGGVNAAGDADGSVQFNTSGSLAGETAFKYTVATNVLTVDNIVLDGANGDITATTASIGNIDIATNIISSTGTNTNLVLSPDATDGNGELVIEGESTIRLLDLDATQGQMEIRQPAAGYTTNYSVTLPDNPGVTNTGPKVMQFTAAQDAIGSFVSNRRTLNFVIDSGGTNTPSSGDNIPVGVRGYVYIDKAMNISDARLVASSQGNAVVEIRILSAGTPPATTLNFGAIDLDLALTNQQYSNSQSTTSVTFPLAVAAGDILEFSVSGTPSVENVTAILVMDPI